MYGLLNRDTGELWGRYRVLHTGCSFGLKFGHVPALVLRRHKCWQRLVSLGGPKCRAWVDASELDVPVHPACHGVCNGYVGNSEHGMKDRGQRIWGQYHTHSQDVPANSDPRYVESIVNNAGHVQRLTGSIPDRFAEGTSKMQGDLYRGRRI